MRMKGEVEGMGLVRSRLTYQNHPDRRVLDPPCFDYQPNSCSDRGGRSGKHRRAEVIRGIVEPLFHVRDHPRATLGKHINWEAPGRWSVVPGIYLRRIGRE